MDVVGSAAKTEVAADIGCESGAPLCIMCHESSGKNICYLGLAQRSTVLAHGVTAASEHELLHKQFLVVGDQGCQCFTVPVHSIQFVRSIIALSTYRSEVVTAAAGYARWLAAKSCSCLQDFCLLISTYVHTPVGFYYLITTVQQLRATVETDSPKLQLLPQGSE
eukprot:427-Heterococcus_DN1.PRE.1